MPQAMPHLWSADRIMNDFAPIGKLVIVVGVILVIVGIFIVYGSRVPFIGRLPGDIHIKKDNFSLYFPITTCILISIILTLVFYLIHKFK